MGYKNGKIRFGAIRSGQYWKKKDTGRTCRILKRNTNDRWTVDFGEFGLKSSHSIKERDLYSYYEKVA